MHRLSLLLPACALLFLGCQRAERSSEAIDGARGQQDEPDVNNAFSHVIAVDTAYFKDGPQQGRPADGTFTAGTAVSVVEEGGSFTRVRTADGVEAYVAVDALKPTGIKQKPN